MGPTANFPYRKGVLHVDGVSVPGLVEKFGTPLYVYSASGIGEAYRELDEGLAPVPHLVCYAVKANSSLGVLRLLARLGAGMDIVSGGELARAVRAGVAPGKIVFSGVGKTAQEIRAALTCGGKGIFSFNVESIEELEQIGRVARSLRRTARVALRFNPDIDAKTHPYISTGLRHNKFGLDAREIAEACRLARRTASIRVAGVSIHIGSQISSLRPLKEAFDQVARKAVDVERSTGSRLEFVDLGGGLGVPYRSGDPSPDVAAYCRLVTSRFGARSPFGSRFRVLIEPGRILTANAGILVSSLLYRKSRPGTRFAIIDAAMNDLMRPALYGSHHEILPVRRRGPSVPMRRYDVVGPVCESADTLGTGRRLPADLEPGEALALLSCGAYGFTMSGNYNSRPRAAEVLVDGHRARLIRRRETPGDLVRGEVS